MSPQQPTDPAAAARTARFGTLPDPIRLDDTVEEHETTPRDPARYAFDSDDWLIRNCG
ncbi:hypothetical protein [Streptomyces sp. B6B3]|uniref:hypothetical protein n=1 Tax=Streptomyces sp. B6B3 TaxID=3153570 RepID=UPI00325F6543